MAVLVLLPTVGENSSVGTKISKNTALYRLSILSKSGLNNCAPALGGRRRDATVGKIKAGNEQQVNSLSYEICQFFSY